MEIPPRLRRALTRLTRDTSFLALGAPLHLFMGFALFMIFGLVREIIAGRDSSAPVILGFALVVTAISVPALTAAQRRRFRRLLGIDVPSPGWRRPWRQAGYHRLAGALFGALEVLAVGLLVAGVSAALTPVWIYALPAQWRNEHVGYDTQAAYLSVAGLLVLAVVPGLAAAVVRLESELVPSLLGRSRDPGLSPGTAYRLTVVCAGTGAADIEFKSATTAPEHTTPKKPVTCDGTPVRDRFTGEKSLRVDVGGRSGATGMIAWRIDKV